MVLGSDELTSYDAGIAVRITRYHLRERVHFEVEPLVGDV
jgi:hypothetical protein